jgi:hypothetical protein
MLAVIAVSIASVKMGYAFYERQILNNQKSEFQIANNGVDTGQYLLTDFFQQEDIPELETKLVETKAYSPETSENESFEAPGQADDSYVGGSCCGSDSVSMLDENGNLKDKDTFLEELEDAVQNGELTEEDREFYLYMYEECAVAFGSSTADSSADGSTGLYPPCH